MGRVCGIAALITAALALIVGSSDAGLKKSDSKVKITTEAGKADGAGKQTIMVTFAIEDGWYIYANPVDNKDFDSNKTTISAVAGKKEIEAKIDYPAGKKKMTGDFTYSVYTGKVSIPVQVTREPGAEVTLTLRFSACNEKGICLLPATVKLNVP